MNKQATDSPPECTGLPEVVEGFDPAGPLGGYADCCGASEAEPTGTYCPPSPEKVAAFAAGARKLQRMNDE